MSADEFAVTVTATASSALDVLLAVEMFAERIYFDRATNPESQEAYNALAGVVLPLREALDAGLAR